MNQYKAIFFNAGGTLIQLKSTTLPELYSIHISEILGTDISSEQVYLAFKKAEIWFLSRKNVGSLFSDLDQRKYQNAFYNSLGIKNRKEINRIENELAEQLEMEFVLEEGTIDLLQSLKDYQLGIISNWDETLREILEELKIIDYFDSITISSEVGINKPDHEIFKSALADFPELKFKNTVYVGDDYYIDIIPAQELHMFTILFDKGPIGLHGRPFQTEVKNIRINKLNELNAILREIQGK